MRVTYRPLTLGSSCEHRVNVKKDEVQKMFLLGKYRYLVKEELLLESLS